MKRIAAAAILFAFLGMAACGEAERLSQPERAYDPIDRTTVPTVPDDEDVLVHLARYPGTARVSVAGEERTPKYGDSQLEKAESVLATRHARPWTVKRLLGWFREAPTSDEKQRAALIYLLAASRDPRGLAVAGPALNDDQLGVRVEATTGIFDYWMRRKTYTGGLEHMMHQAHEWWEEHGETIVKAR